MRYLAGKTQEQACLRVLVGALAALMLVVAFAPGMAWAANSHLAAGAKQVDVETQVQLGKTFTKGGTTYKVIDLDDDGGDLPEVMLVKYGSSNRKPVIDTVVFKGQTFEVERIARNAFNNAKGHRITRLTLGESVDDIGSKAFYGCSKLKVIDLRAADVIDIDRVGKGYRIDDIDIGAKAFAKAGVAKLKVKCGKFATGYQKAFKRALAKKGMRSDAVIVK